MADAAGGCKIAFVGTGGTGKSTLCHALAGDPGVVIVPEAARQYFSEHEVAPEERYSGIVQGTIQRLVVENEMNALLRFGPSKKYVCDRSVLDAVIYAQFGGDAVAARHMLDFARTHLPTYSKLVLLNPADVPYAEDPIRIESPETRITIHEMFLRCLETERIPYELLSGSVDVRVERVREWLGE
jgi:predicted ATPase